MKPSFLHLLAVLLWAGSAAAASALDVMPSPPAASPAALGFDPARLARVEDYLSGVVARGGVAGASFILARHGRVVDFRAYGKADLATGRPLERDAVVRIYSMSKPLTGVAMMILFEEGKWRLDDPVTKFIPEFKDLRVLVREESPGRLVTVPANRPPTMRELMSHTAGFGYGLSDANPVDRKFRESRVLQAKNLKELVDRTAAIPLLFQPGTDWSYSVAVDLQGYIVEKLSGMSLGEFLKTRVFGPLKMNDTGFYAAGPAAGRLAEVYAADPKTGALVVPKTLFGGDMPDYRTPPALESGGGGLVSTAHDYARFCQMMLNKGELDGVRILSPASVELMGTNVIPDKVLVKSNGTLNQSFDENVGFGLDLRVDTAPRRAGSLEGKGSLSWGGAAGTWFWIDPTNDLYFVGIIQRLGGIPGEDMADTTNTLVYSALTHPER